MAKVARGVRNNNPLNIEWTGRDKWQGIANPPHDGRFCVFIEAPYGIRAAAKNLQTYSEQKDLHTVREIITEWCPPEKSKNDPNGNDTEAYIAEVCDITGYHSNTVINAFDYDQVSALLKAMATVECNGLPDYPSETWEKGLRMAGVVQVKAPVKQRTNTGVAINATGATALIIATIGDLVPELSPVLAPLVEKLSDPWAIAIAVGLVVLGNSTVLYARFDDWRNGRR